MIYSKFAFDIEGKYSLDCMLKLNSDYITRINV